LSKCKDTFEIENVFSMRLTVGVDEGHGAGRGMCLGRVDDGVGGVDVWMAVGVDEAGVRRGHGSSTGHQSENQLLRC